MDALRQLADIVGTTHVLTDASQTDPYCNDERGLFHGRALAVLRPATRTQLAEVVGTCHRLRLAMVPHGGNTGYCGGATPDPGGQQVVISLERLNRTIEVDAHSATITLEAGVILAEAQAQAARHNLLLPLSMGSQGSCQIGGNLSTNAGGLAVLRYGTARDLTLGLEVVLADGRMLSNLSGLRKNNTGYDLKQLFIGAEGSLGFISAATLKLFPRPHASQTVLAAVTDLAGACALLALVRATIGDQVTAFEYMSDDALALSAGITTAAAVPFAQDYEHFVLFEWSEFDGAQNDPVSTPVSELLAQALDDGLLVDAVIAQNETQRRELWRVRESVPAAERACGGSIKHDVSVRLSDVPRYVEQTSAELLRRWPAARLSIFGHIGDGNVHFNVLAPSTDTAVEFQQAHGEAISDVVHEAAHRLGGSFSAEHGIGQFKRDLLIRYSDDVALEMMRGVKSVFDPCNLMNPGKVL